MLFCSGLAPAFSQQKLYDLDQITTVDITIDDPLWRKKLISYKESHEKKRVLGAVKVNGIQFDSIGIRFKGNSSFFSPYQDSLNKLPLNLKLSYKIKDQAYAGGYRTLKLSNVFRDPSFLRESLSYIIARTYVPAPECNFAKVTVNGEYWGLYNLTQSIDEQFQKEHYGSEEGLLFKCDPSWNEKPAFACEKGDKANLAYLGEDAACYLDKYELKRSKKGWKHLIALIKQLNDQPSELESMMNVDEALWMLAFNNLFVNLDSYSGRLCHNYYLYQDTFKVWHPLLWDMNLSMGGFRFTGLGGRLDNEQMGNLSMFLHLKEKNKQRPLITKLLEISLFRKIYVAHIKTMYEDFLKEDQYVSIADGIRSKIREHVQEDEQKLYDEQGFEDNFVKSVIVGRNQEIVGIQELLEGRKAYLKNHPLIKAATPNIESHSVVANAESTNVTVDIAAGEPAEKVWIFYRGVINGPWKRTALTSSEENKFTTSFPAGTILEYYLVAEGKRTVQVLPARSGKEWLSVTEGR